MVTKKRKLGTSGRLVGSINKTKTIKKGKGIHTLDFTPHINLCKPSNLLVSIQLNVESEIEVESTLSN
jgi:hypothetical protein